MSKPKMVTEAEAVRRERAAYLAGLEQHACTQEGHDRLKRDVSLHYPLPRITRPRVVRDTSTDGCPIEWRVTNGNIECRQAAGTWYEVAERGGAKMWITPQRVAFLADLLANPTETVEDA